MKTTFWKIQKLKKNVSLPEILTLLSIYLQFSLNKLFQNKLTMIILFLMIKNLNLVRKIFLLINMKAIP